MKTNPAGRIVGYALLGTIAAASFLLPQTLTVPTISAAPMPAELRLTGKIRDFRRSHPDFDVVPASGYGHYAGTVQTALGADGRPRFADGSPGDAWSETADGLVAHWKFDDGGGSVAADVAGANPGTLVDGPVWVAGQADGALRFDGVDDHVEVPSSPEIQITGDITFSGWFKLDEDFHSGSPDTMVIMEKFFDTEQDFHVALAGNDYNRPEVAKGSLVFKVENGSDGEHYRYKWTNRTSWTAGTWYHFAATLTSADTAENTLVIDGVDDTSAADAGGIGFIDTDYDAPFRIGGKTVDYNGFATDIFFKGVIDDVKIFRRALVTEDFTPPTAGGFKVTAQWTDALSRPIAPHLHEASGVDACGDGLTDTTGLAGTADTGGISSLDTFSQWFRDLPGTNQSSAHTIKLTLDDSGVYVYLDDAFYPLDGRLLGNEGEANNNHFTYHIRAEFRYAECAAQFLEFVGGDGVWVFIDDRLVVDLGGVGAIDGQRIDLDRLGLTDGETYRLDLFYAQRQSADSVFRLRTTLELATGSRVPTVSAMFD